MMTRGQPCVQTARPQPHPWEVVIPRTRTGRESTNCQATDSRQRCDFKLKARRARTEADKVPPPATPLQYSSPVVPRQTSQAGKVLRQFEPFEQIQHPAFLRAGSLAERS